MRTHSPLLLVVISVRVWLWVVSSYRPKPHRRWRPSLLSPPLLLFVRPGGMINPGSIQTPEDDDAKAREGEKKERKKKRESPSLPWQAEMEFDPERSKGRNTKRGYDLYGYS